MNQSDVSKLKTFVSRLPKDKVLSDNWNERYIYDLDTYSGYDSSKIVSINNNRNVNIQDMMIDGYSLRPYESRCDDNDCDECCSEDNEYDPIKCNQYFTKNVRNWEELCGYHILFLQGKTPGTPNHPGPWNKETQYILEPLIRILKAGIMTIDSQPGLLVCDGDEEYIQKPYLLIGGPADRVHRLLIKLLFPAKITLDTTITKYVPYGVKKVNFDMYYDFIVDKNYVSVMLGIETPNILSNEFNKYLFSNRFFNHIANIVETTL